MVFIQSLKHLKALYFESGLPRRFGHENVRSCYCFLEVQSLFQLDDEVSLFLGKRLFFMKHEVVLMGFDVTYRGGEAGSQVTFIEKYLTNLPLETFEKLPNCSVKKPCEKTEGGSFTLLHVYMFNLYDRCHALRHPKCLIHSDIWR